MSGLAGRDFPGDVLAQDQLRRVFLVGCPRSGTTLLQSLLAAHPLVHSLPETHFFQNLLHSEEHRRDARRRSATARLQVLRRKALVALGHVGGRRARRAWQQMPEFDAADAPAGDRLQAHVARFVELMDRQCRGAGRQVWLEKTPDHLYYLRHIRRHVPDARIVHLIRDGEEVVASLRGAAEKYPDWQPFLDLDHAVSRWNHALRESLAWAGQPGHLLVRYEALLADPEQVLRRICTFIECEYQPGMVARAGTASAGLVRADEPWKGGVAGGLCDRRKFDRTFCASQCEAIRAGLDKVDWRQLSRLPGIVAGA